MNTSLDQARVRAIMQLAGEGAPSSVGAWLKRDEFGGWERAALALLAKTREPAIALRIKQEGLSDADINQHLANELVLAALTATLADARKHEGARGLRRRRLSPR